MRTAPEDRGDAAGVLDRSVAVIDAVQHGARTTRPS